MLLHPVFPEPRCTAKCAEQAREDMDTSFDASEYHDCLPVLDQKIQCLATMIKKSKSFCVYTGAGLSTAAGIGDYASKAKGTKGKRWNPKDGPHMEYLKEMRPTFGHKALTALERAGYLKQFINQNHDGLALKAGFPLEKLNEIHGSWFDNRNPVVSMDGSMRKDLMQRLEQWEESADLVLSLGTSLSGLTADGVCAAAAKRAEESGNGLGLVIVSLTKTGLDDLAAIRIFATIDDVLARLSKLLKLERYFPNDQEIQKASKRSSLWHTYALWYRDFYDKQFKRETKKQIRRRAQPNVKFC